MIIVMTHLHKLRTQHFLRWVCFINSRDSFKPPIYDIVKSCFSENPKFYGTERVVETEICENAVKKNNVKISRATRAHAQTALLEYLYNTRSLRYADAENMSKNSPHFLGKLLRRVDTTETNTDIKHLVTRFLRYHPIDEFELFFESLGLKPMEFASLLPHDLTFLSDDKMLLENYQVLCNYGIERNKIGKVYKEATEIFRYDYDVLKSKIRAYEDLGLEQRLLINAIVSSPTVLIGDVNSSFVEMLDRLKIMGFDCCWIESRLKEHDLINWNQILEALRVFSRLGFTEEQLVKLINKNPRLLFEGSGKITSSLIGLLLKFGSTEKELFLSFLEFPQFEIAQFIYNLRRAIQLFTDIQMEPEHFGRIVCSYPLLLGGGTLMSCHSLLKSMNVGRKRICNIIIENPLEMKNWVLGTKIQRLPKVRGIISRQEKIKFLLDLGFVEDSKEMKKALKICHAKGGELEERFKCFIKAGLDRQDAVQMVKRAPLVLNQSKDVIEVKLDFLLNGLKFPISTLKIFPRYLSFTIEKVKLRFTMYSWLKDQGTIGRALALSTFITIPDIRFEKDYVEKHPKGPQVWQKLLSDWENNVKISLVTRVQAQTALLEYFYYTTSLPYADAENMSKNSPHFLAKLLKRVETTEANSNIKGSVACFLQYHPINEFEPFFESIGLEPLEIASLIPLGLTFLSDDTMLLENYQVLCDYGIKRNRIGKVYKEATEIFRYENDVLKSKIRAYEALGFHQSFLRKVIVSTPTVLIGDIDTSLVEVIENLKIMGFDCCWIESHLKEHDLINWRRMTEVLCLFCRLGFTEEQLVKLINKHPRLLFEGSGKITFSLIGLLLKFGSAKKELVSVFLESPQFEIVQFAYNLRMAIQFLTDIEIEPEHFGRIVRSYPVLLGESALKKCSSILCNLNVGRKHVCNIIIENPLEMKNWVLGAKIQPVLNSGKEEKIKFLLKLGFVEDSVEMKRALKNFYGKGGELEERFNCFIKAGLDRQDVVHMVKRTPPVLNQSKHVIEVKLDFLLNGLKLPISTLKIFPRYVCFTIEKVKLRLTMYSWLKNQGTIGRALALSTIIEKTDKRFEKDYVEKHPKGSQVWQILRKQIFSR